MGITEMILVLQSIFGPEFQHDNFCQNLYFQPNALEQMDFFYCDIDAVEKHIYNTQKSIYY